jgi:hypothetical protein
MEGLSSKPANVCRALTRLLSNADYPRRRCLPRKVENIGLNQFRLTARDIPLE